MNLSPHFTLDELVASQTAARLGIDNTPPADIIERLRHLCLVALEPARTLLGNKAVTITSGFRCLAVNRAIGSGDTSAHVRGLAADFICPGFGTPLDICRAISQSDIAFDQVIHEFGSWCHLGLSATLPRRMLLTIDGAGTRYGLE